MMSIRTDDFERLDLPSRRSFDRALVEYPPYAMDIFRRVAALAPDSAELRNLRATLEEKSPPK
jgi:hypothetical protein